MVEVQREGDGKGGRAERQDMIRMPILLLRTPAQSQSGNAQEDALNVPEAPILLALRIFGKFLKLSR